MNMSSKYKARIEARRSNGDDVVGYAFQQIRDNKVPFDDLYLLPQEKVAVEEMHRKLVEQKAKEAAESEEQVRRHKLYLEKREAEFQAQLEKMRAANLPTEDTVDAIRHDGELLGIEFDPENMLKGASREDILAAIHWIMKAVNNYFYYGDKPSPISKGLLDKAIKSATTSEQVLEILGDILSAVNNWDDSYHNKHLVVVRPPDPDCYEIVDLGDNCRYEIPITIFGGYGLGQHYRFVEEDDDEDEEEVA